MTERMVKKEIISSSEKETEQFAASFAEKAEPGIIALHGALGAGKSVFARAFASALGVKGYMPSPTFTIAQEYRIPKSKNISFNTLYHLDLYRIKDSNAAFAFGIDEFLDDNYAVSLIEWPERIADILPEDTIHITFQHINESSRRITIEKEEQP
jgi:tRNA threonylcarbamoyladenosine biosynthesis protein TsaE